MSDIINLKKNKDGVYVPIEKEENLNISRDILIELVKSMLNSKYVYSNQMNPMGRILEKTIDGIFKKLVDRI